MKTRLLLAPCLASGLVVRAGEEPGGGTAGSVYYRIEFTNLSTATCTITGYALNFPADKCKATTAAGLRVAIPGGSGNKIAPLPFETCVRATTKTLSVAPVQATVSAN